MKTSVAPVRKARNRVSVWVVDDNKNFCFFLTEALNQTRLVNCARTFHSCPPAIDALIKENTPPDVILLDIKMPKMSGLDAVAKMRELCPKTRIIMLTSYDSDDNIRIAINQGASGYLLKTSSPTEIVSAVVKAHKGGAALDAMIAKRILEVYLGQHEANPYRLTRREQDVLRCAATGLRIREMAEKLGLSFHTVDNHLRNIHRKFKVHNRQSLIAKATKERII